MAIKVAMIDDHLILGQGLSQLLSINPSFEFIGFYSDTDMIKSILSEQKIDVILLDISVPPTNGIEFCKWLKQKYPSIKVVFLTMHFDSLIINRAMKSGGNGYITKDVDSTILFEAIMSVAEGKIYYSKNIENILLNKPFQQASSKKPPILSPRELEILNYIVKGFTSQEIAEKLFITTKTIDFHRSNLLVKFDSKNVAELTREAVLHGFS